MNFSMLVFPGVEELDFIGPWEMLTMWSKTIAKNMTASPEACFCH